MRHGFYARVGFVFGSVSVTRGLGGFGTQPLDTDPPDVEDKVLVGVGAPRAVPTNRRSPKTLMYVPGAKKKRGGV